MSDDIDEIWAAMKAEAAVKPTKNTSLPQFQKTKKKPGNEKSKFQLQGGYGSIANSQSASKQAASLSWLANYGIAKSNSSTSSSSGSAGRQKSSHTAGTGGASSSTAASTDAEPETTTSTSSDVGDATCSLEQSYEPIAENVPLDSPEAFLAHLQRDVNVLDSGSEVDLKTRLRALKKLDLLIIQNHANLPTDILDCALEELSKPLLKRLQRDSAEKIREKSSIILKTLVECAPAETVGSVLRYVIPILVSRLGAEDLDGVAHLPPVMRPNPEQRPCEIRTPAEPSEEVRLQLALFIQAFVERISTQQVLCFVDELCGLLRALCMDPYAGVKQVGCETLSTFCYNHHEVLLHFTEPLGRSVTSSLVHNHFKLRIAALQTLTAVLHCGTWKHNHEVFQLLVAWSDPNSVPIKSFYEHVTTVNYFSSLTFDRHPAVRRFWFETLAYWLLRLPDHVDHEPHIFPYLLSGLYDENEDIALETFWLLEACGAQYEVDNEKDLREKKQYGLDAAWTYKGKVLVPFPLQGRWRSDIRQRTQPQGPDFQGKRAEETRPADLDVGRGDSEEHIVELPKRDYSWHYLDCLYVSQRLPRPRLGARMWVRTHIRRFIKALFNNVLDFRECNMLNASRLLTMCVAYAEDNITEWLSSISEALIKFYSGKAYLSGSAELAASYDLIGKLIGSYVEPSTIWLQYEDSFSIDTVWYLEQRLAVFHLLTRMLDGGITSLEKFWLTEKMNSHTASTLGHLEAVVPPLIKKLGDCDLIQDPCNSDGLPVAETMWNLVVMVARLGPQALSRELRCKLLVLAVALVAGLEEYRKATTMEEIQELSEQMDLSKDGTEGGAGTTRTKFPSTATPAAGPEFFEANSCPLTHEGKTKTRKSASTPLEKLLRVSTWLEVRVDDVEEELVAFTKHNFASFRAFCRVLPIQKIVLCKPIAVGLQNFADPGEESQTRLQALRLAADLLQREDWYYRNRGANTASKVVVKLDMDDIDTDESYAEGKYEMERKNFIANMFSCFTPVLENATKSPPDKPKKMPKTLDEVNKKIGEQAAAVAALADGHAAAPGKVADGASKTSEEEVEVVPEDPYIEELDEDEDDIVVEEVSEVNTQENSSLLPADDEEQQEVTTTTSSTTNTVLVQTTPYFVLAQSLSVLRTLVISKFQDVETVSTENKAWEVENLSDCLNHLPATILHCLAALVCDVEYYKRVARSLEQQERINMNKTDEDDLTAMKMKEIRETSLEKATQARLNAAEILFLLLRSKYHTNCVATVVKEKTSTTSGTAPTSKQQQNTTKSNVSPSDAKEYNVVPRTGSKSNLLVVSATQDHPLWEVRDIFAQIRTLLKTKHTPTLQPLFVRPTPPQLLLFSSEILRLFLQTPGHLIQTKSLQSQLYDDAARRILLMEAPHFSDLDPRIVQMNNGELFFPLVSDSVLQLMDLNLSLPPQPNHPLTPIVSSHDGEQKPKAAMEVVMAESSVLGDGSMNADPIPIGWIAEEEREAIGVVRLGAAKGEPVSGAPRGAKRFEFSSEPVMRVMQQSEECLRWNAALSLYKLLGELTKIDPTHLLTAAHRWENEGKQGRIGLVRHLISMLDLMSMK